MGCGDDFRPRSGQPVSDAALCAQTLGLRKLRRSVTRLKAQVALRFAPLRRWRLLRWQPAPPALSYRTLRSSRLQRSDARISESSAALQTRLRGRRLQNAAHNSLTLGPN